MENISDFNTESRNNDGDENMVNSVNLTEQLHKYENSLISDISCEERKDLENGNFSNGNNSVPENEAKTSESFHIDQTTIPLVPENQQVPELQNLGVCAYDQTQFETEVIGQVEKAIKEEEQHRKKQEIEKELKSVAEDIKFVKQRLGQIEKALLLAPKNESLMTNIAKREVITLKKERENKLKHLKKLEAKQKTLCIFFTGDVNDLNHNVVDNEGSSDIDEETRIHLQEVFAPKESEEERLIRTGQMTPFGTKHPQMPKPKKIMIPQNQLTDFDKFLLEQVNEKQKKKLKKSSSKNVQKVTPTKRYIISSNMSQPSTSTGSVTLKEFVSSKAFKPTTKKMKLGSKYADGFKVTKQKDNIEFDSDCSVLSDFKPSDNDEDDTSDKEYKPEHDLYNGSDSDIESIKSGNSILSNKRKKSINGKMKKSPSKNYRRLKDDGCQESYIKRMKDYKKSELLKKHEKIMASESGIIDSDEECTEFDDFKVPSCIWNKLYRYQQTGVRWLWELHQQNCGGIVGDEMGLGKTIQIIAFLVGLETTHARTDGDLFRGKGPVLLVCPTTVMHQWVKEFHAWWPPFRAAILHESGSFTGKKPSLVSAINRARGILVTSYSGLVQHQLTLLEYDWHYIILDEGHKIRNPDAQATLVAKQFRTPHRLILSGSPIQNNLKELWSLFDFVFPGKLGTLPVFMQQFSVPIVQGGYANATQVQVQTAYKCATMLRNSIKPYLLRRMKNDVKMNIQLPNKNEQVLFCKLTEDQVQLYKTYIDSSEVQSIISARLQVFVGLINLRKMCNHPDLYTGGPKIFKHTDLSTLAEDEHYGYYKHSGKMIVVESLLRLWHKQGHRVLLFTQSRQMMVILELFIKQQNYTYMKMDGGTPISSRQPAINTFNSDASIFVFLLTTRVGGLGVNLTGANRVIIYDPDWNPSTDAQARERSWRIGQDKEVTIYRLLTAGTIEEKIYHRQIFKQFVTNRVLKDPRQRRFFKSNDLYELFTFSEVGKQGTETSAMFAGTGSEIKPIKNLKKQTTLPSPKSTDIEVAFSSTKIQKMKELAKKLSAQLTQAKPEDIKEQIESSNADLTPKSDTAVSNVNMDFKTSIGTEIIIDNKNISSNKEKPEVKVDKLSKKKNKHLSKKKWKSTIVEGEEIRYLLKSDIYKPSQEENEMSNTNDDYVLSKLFKKSGVHTALKHDAIVDASAPDYMLVEGEANRVAQEAIKALRRSRRECARAEEGIPTWTGSNGALKHRFGTKKRLPPTATLSSSNSTPLNKTSRESSGIFCKRSDLDTNKQKNDGSSVLSSSDLLSAVKKRKEVFNTGRENDNSDNEESRTEMKSQTEYDELLVEIRNFIAFGAATDGQATTQEILRKFKSQLPKEHTAVFKSLLNKICDFSRVSSGDGIWYLKGEFR